MLKRLTTLVSGIFFAGSALAAPFTISNEVARGNCDADLFVEQDQDGGCGGGIRARLEGVGEVQSGSRTLHEEALALDFRPFLNCR